MSHPKVSKSHQVVTTSVMLLFWDSLLMLQQPRWLLLIRKLLFEVNICHPLVRTDTDWTWHGQYELRTFLIFLFCLIFMMFYLPDRLMMQFGFPTAHKLTFLSSPPVTRTLPDLWPRERQLTSAPWATNSCSFQALLAGWPGTVPDMSVFVIGSAGYWDCWYTITIYVYH